MSVDFRPIATSLMRAIWRWATLCACLIGSIQAVFSCFHVQNEFEMQVRDVGRSNIPLLSISIWDIEPDIVQRQLDAIAEKPQIGFVSLTVSTGQVFTAGESPPTDKLTAVRFDIPPPGRPSGHLGRLDIYENPQAFYREMLYNVAVALLGYGILTFLICTLVVYFLKRELADPLRHIARFVATLTPDRLTTPLKLERPDGHVRDEIDLVVDGFKVLQDGVNGYIANLDELVAQRTQELETAMLSIQHLSSVDSLTGCFNRRLFNERIVQELERAERYERPLSVAFCDIDHFKQVNDLHGHWAGDQVLKAVAGIFQRLLRSDVDWVARYGGEEFVIVLAETGLNEAVSTAERLRLAIEQEVVFCNDKALNITASFGVAQYSEGDSVQVLLQKADSLLYVAKQAGRNRTLPSP
ncbi:GGDEF domain-containing protein [Dechloromonas denitrificans]|uniref:sensor domain-containing diguanylate cyclase n=1 Tax=Dechloromonas denitrificans TaxID=281362 RepID=UPI001CF90258|nr:GGDEF domain-containing protein [Dechloromonas denitrificans]